MGNAGACLTLPVIGRLTGHGVLLISVGLKKMFYLQIILVTGEENPLQEESEDLALHSASAFVTLDLTSVSFGFFIYEM